MANYTDKLAVGEQAISDFINGKLTIRELENRLSASLSSCKFYNKQNTFEISIIRTDRSKEPFFGARVYPAIDMLEKLVGEIVTEFHPFREIWASWQHIDHWVVEIDSEMFDRDTISLLPKEIMAAILHEIGHTVYSDKVLERFYRAYKSMYVHMKTAEKDTLKLGYALFSIPLALSCSIRSWTRGRNAIKEEFFADNIVKDCGYGDFYVSLLSKIIEAYGNSMVDGNDVESDNKISERVRWASINIVDTTRRKNHLSDEIFMSAARTPSAYLKALYSKVLNEMGVNLRERYTGDAVESTVELLSSENVTAAYEATCDTEKFRTLEICIEGNLHRSKFIPGTPAFEGIVRTKQKQGLPSWIDIDRIQIEIDRMTNHHDRAFVLDMIYDKIDEINEFMEYVGADPNLRRKYEPEAQKMLDALNAQREAVLKRNSFANRYKVFVKYPAGYEG